MENIRIIKSKRKTISLEITSNGTVVLKVPLQVNQQEINEFFNSKSKWIENNLKKFQDLQHKRCKAKILTTEELASLKKDAIIAITKKVEYFSQIIGVTYNKINIRCQKTRWGSCSGKGNLNFNCLLMLMPEKILDYVVIHELCHRIEMNHSKQFWQEVEKIIPDYSIRRNWLNEHGYEFMIRIKRQA